MDDTKVFPDSGEEFAYELQAVARFHVTCYAKRFNPVVLEDVSCFCCTCSSGWYCLRQLGLSVGHHDYVLVLLCGTPEGVPGYSCLQILVMHMTGITVVVVHVCTDFRCWRSSYVVRQWHIRRLTCKNSNILVSASRKYVFIQDVCLSAGDVRGTR